VGIAYRAVRSLGCTVSVWDGTITAEDVRRHLIRLAGDNNWPPGRLHLTDLTTITKATVPEPELLDLLYEGTNVAQDLKVAVVVRPEPRFTADLRYASAAEELSAITFDDFALACAYLGVRPGAIQETLSALRQELDLQNATRC
jgi:hypothetical protein